MGFLDLSVFILQHVGLGAMENTYRTGGQGRCMLLGLKPGPSGFNADHLYIIFQKRVKQPHGIAPAADTGNQ